MTVIYVPSESMTGTQHLGAHRTLEPGTPSRYGRRPQPVPKQPVHFCNKQHIP